jgi:hypothetical protein
MKFHEKMFIYATYIVYILYVLAFFGVWGSAPTYLAFFNYWRQVLVGVLLVFYFHPFRKTTFTVFHRKIVFAAGVFLLMTTILHGIFVV